MDPTLNELEQRLDPTRFFRVSRAALINLNAVDQVHPIRDLLQSLEGMS